MHYLLYKRIMSQQYTLTGIIYQASFKPRQLKKFFPDSKITKKQLVEVIHPQYCLCFEGNLLSAQASQYQLLAQGLEDCLQQQNCAYMFEVFEVDGRLVARFQG